MAAPAASDLGLDVLITAFQSGDYWDLSLRNFGNPIFWRPKVALAGRLYYLKTLETKQTFAVTQKMPWAEFWSRQLTWRALFRLRPTFDVEDMERLVYMACHALLDKVRRTK